MFHYIYTYLRGLPTYIPEFRHFSYDCRKKWAQKNGETQIKQILNFMDINGIIK